MTEKLIEANEAVREFNLNNDKLFSAIKRGDIRWESEGKKLMLYYEDVKRELSHLKG